MIESTCVGGPPEYTIPIDGPPADAVLKVEIAEQAEAEHSVGDDSLRPVQIVADTLAHHRDGGMGGIEIGNCRMPSNCGKFEQWAGHAVGFRA